MKDDGWSMKNENEGWRMKVLRMEDEHSGIGDGVRRIKDEV